MPGTMNNRSMRDYMVKSLGELADPARLSDQARAVRAVLLDEETALDDAQRLLRLRELLSGEAALEEDTMRWLERVLRGHLGAEYQAYELTRDDAAAFWRALSERWPTDARPRAIWADDLLLAGDLDESLGRFNEAFELDPSLIFAQSADVFEAMRERGGATWLRFGLSWLRARLDEDDAEGAADLAEELRESFAGDAEALRRIGAILPG